MTKNGRLTEKQEVFVREYVATGLAKESALKAGVPLKSASKLATLWLNEARYPVVVQAVRHGKQDLAIKAGITGKRILDELARVGFFDPRQLFDENDQLLPVTQLPEHVARVIKKVRLSQRIGRDEDGEVIRVKVTEIELWSKLDALKQLAQHLGLLKGDTTNLNIINIEWDKLLELQQTTYVDPIEAKIESVKALPPPTTNGEQHVERTSDNGEAAGEAE
jgi:phage terminase small subunit